MLLFLSVTGIFLSAILLYFNSRDNKSTLYLGLFFMFLSLYSLYQYILLYSKSVTLISLFLFNIAIISSPVYLIGPLLYWYIRSVLTDDSALKKNDIWHLLPMVIYFVAAFPHAFIPWQEKVEAARALVQDANFIQEYRATLLSRIFPAFIEYLSRPLLVFGYTLWSAGLCIQHMRKRKVSVVFSKQRFMKKWLCLFLGFLLVMEITQIFQVIRGFEMHFSDLYFALNLVRIISAVGLTGLLISPFFFPVILYGLPRIPGSMMEEKKDNRSGPSHQGRKNKNQNNFEEAYLISVGQKVEICMKDHQPYLQPDCNLGHLAKKVNVPVHHLAYYFREVKNKHFTDYRNEWRVNHAKTLILEGKANELTLETIGMLSGFSSRNAFITDFKKIEGISPGVFADRVN